ncbi:hypothetical protein IWQ57_002622 [Coemansia nantahalensis]|uniref:Uncharacterized protein n=1 Tax=Coemansia nantahalensis TaxID=2789366 RepID=A0ACC1JZI3_9FUNG|nr:hypothetical protein IWQ57_002622 [Coemansia nantahalensis]
MNIVDPDREYKFSLTKCMTGSNVILMSLYAALFIVYIGLATLNIGFMGEVASKQPGQFPGSPNPGVQQDTQGLNELGRFGQFFAVATYICGAILVLGWMAMCAFRRHVFIGYFKLHRKTNILVEALFVSSHICIIVSDRTFVNILPPIETITFPQFVYPLAMAVLCCLGVTFLFLLIKLTCVYRNTGAAEKAA